MESLLDIRTAKTVGLLIFFITFCLIVFWVYGSRKRGERLEEHKNIPFMDDDVDEAKDKSNG
jgi:cbb3-type cytochrome oxidase subunit 3